MNWWAWVIGGALLLGAELGFVDAQFYLVFIGSAAVLVGLACALFPGLPAWAQWAAFAVLLIVTMIGFRQRVYQLVRGRLPAVRTGPVGSWVTLPVALEPGGTCQAEHGGSYWTVCNDAAAPLLAGTRARVVAVDGLTLRVRPESETA